MTRWTIDTNVPVVANGRDDRERPLALECREAAVRFLVDVLDKEERVVLDAEGNIQAEYRRRLRPIGQPGVGDRFYRTVLQDWTRCERVSLPKRDDGEYVDLPQGGDRRRLRPERPQVRRAGQARGNPGGQRGGRRLARREGGTGGERHLREVPVRLRCGALVLGLTGPPPWVSGEAWFAPTGRRGARTGGRERIGAPCGKGGVHS